MSRDQGPSLHTRNGGARIDTHMAPVSDEWFDKLVLTAMVVAYLLTWLGVIVITVLSWAALAWGGYSAFSYFMGAMQ